MLRAGKLAIIIAAIWVPLPLAAVETAASPVRPAITWRPCPENNAVDCGTITVPLDWSHPYGPGIDLSLARRRATDPAARVGSLLFNWGGPGAPSVDPLILNDSTGFSPELERRFDIVGWDTRGVGRSPILCSAGVVEPIFTRLTGRLPANQAEFDQITALSRQLFADCRAHTGPMFDHVDTLNTVRDLEAIRAALGEHKLTYYGSSYGSLIGQQYAERFPHRVRAIALDGVVDHSLDTTSYWRTTAAAVQDSFNEFVAWSDRTPESPLHGQDVRAIWHELLDRAAEPEILIGTAYGFFNEPDWSGLARLFADLHAGSPVPGKTLHENGSEPIAFPALIFCADFSLPIRDYRDLKAQLRNAAQVAPDMQYFAEAPAASLACSGAPTPIPNPQHRLRVRDASTPLLLVNAVHDPTSGYAWATEVARQLGDDGVLLTYDGWGHHAYRRAGACVDDAIDNYLLAQRIPERGTHCPADQGPRIR